MLMVSLETQRKSSPQTAVSCQRGQRAGGGGGGGGWGWGLRGEFNKAAYSTGTSFVLL